jgi:Uncharacterized conserved protein
MKHITLSVLLLFGGICFAQNLPLNFNIPPIPNALEWVNTPLDWDYSNGKLTITGGEGSRLFVDPQRLSEANSAPMALFQPDETFLFSCKVKVDFKSIFDAGVLMIYGNPYQWAKFCFEYTPQHENMIVSVVNNELSDDNNHIVTDKNEIYMRIAGLGNGAYAFHYSTDGKYWHMARYFYLNPKHQLRIGFLSQSPRGESFTSIFSDIKYSTNKLDNIRNGD